MTDQVQQSDANAAEKLAEVETKLAPATNPEDSGTSPGNDTAAPEQETKKKARAPERINQLTREKYEARREAEEERKRREEAERRLQELESKIHVKPDRHSFESDDDYDQALIEWSRRQAPAPQQQQGQDNPPPTAEEIAYKDKFTNTLDYAQESGYEDFQEKVQAIPVLSFDVVKETLDSQISADLLYYLANNHKEAERLSGLTGAQLTREVGKLEARIEAGVVKPNSVSNGQAVSKAPEPIEPIEDTGKQGSIELSDDLPADEWLRRRNARRHSR